jgi:hypothetical protein
VTFLELDSLRKLQTANAAKCNKDFAEVSKADGIFHPRRLHKSKTVKPKFVK